jgi:hypothetical protein
MAKIMQNRDTRRGSEVKLSAQTSGQMIGRMIAPAAQMMLLGRPNVQISTLSNER